LKAASNPQIIAFFLLTVGKRTPPEKLKGNGGSHFPAGQPRSGPTQLLNCTTTKKTVSTAATLSEHLQEFDELWDWWETQWLAELSESEPREI